MSCCGVQSCVRHVHLKQIAFLYGRSSMTASSMYPLFDIQLFYIRYIITTTSSKRYFSILTHPAFSASVVARPQARGC